MKIALGFSGQPRLYKEIYPYIKKYILDVYDTDIYCHCWWSEEEVNTKMIGAGAREIEIDNNVPTGIKKLFNPKAMLIEPSLLKNEEKYRENFKKRIKELYPHRIGVDRYVAVASSEFWLSHYLSMHRMYNLIDWNQNYDWFFQWRFDALPERIPNLYELEKNKLYSFIDNWGTFSDNNDAYNVLGYFLDPSNLKLRKLIDILPYYMDVIDEIISSNEEVSDTQKFVPEHFRMEHAKFLGVQDAIIKLPNNQFSVQLPRNPSQLI